MKKFKSLRKSLQARNNSFLSSGLLVLSLLSIAGSIFTFNYVRNRSNLHGYYSLGLQSITKSINVSAFVGEFRFTLVGYTSPYARVILEGQGIYDETFADKYGNFTFYNRFSPLSPREACITAHDTYGRFSKPLCLPPFPVNKNAYIGPILLPPTVSTSQNIFLVNDYGSLSGMAAPNSNVTVDIYSNVQDSKIPIQALTDASGNYSITVPTDQYNTVRSHSINYYKSITSDKSITLTMQILPLWLYMLRQLIFLATYLKGYLIPIILLIESIILLYIYLRGRKKKDMPLVCLLPGYRKKTHDKPYTRNAKMLKNTP